MNLNKFDKYIRIEDMNWFKKIEETKEETKYFYAYKAIYDYCINVLKYKHPVEIYIWSSGCIKFVELNNKGYRFKVGNNERGEYSIADLDELKELVKPENLGEHDTTYIKTRIFFVYSHDKPSIYDTGVEYKKVSYEDLCNVVYREYHGEISGEFDLEKYISTKEDEQNL